jgi:hypothetical protein
MNLKTEENLVNLTDIWKASGGERRISPANWKVCAGSGYVEAIATRTSEQVWKSKKGTNGYTLATWEIAFAYAKWISPEIHLSVVREWLILNGGDESLMAFAIPEILELTEAGKDLLILTQMKME